ncbi:beta-propeller domain-containing protein [Planococcus sp. ISL-109]|uniref:beta-propeller domain-containing protein n=1 Tax=Planococcus sp. ISL-109 TaxID=2819166 RepID=UPI001BE5AC3D|nr:beta-propeller domain-containing protein [Planococcus sp. ISL-109]MBT2583489.1 beta-propeller domain-containing protein [Planococcus sp. ISL-109]
MKLSRAWWIGAILLVLSGAAFFLLTEKVAISASPTALSEFGWRANFSAPLDPQAIEKGAVFITDGDGRKLDLDMRLTNGDRTLEVPEIQSGDYTLHLKKSALASNFLKTLPTDQLAFSIQDEVENLAGEEELRAYFTQLLQLQKDNPFYRGFGAGVDEAEDGASGESNGMGGGEHSTTNSQVAGIDEGDVVKTDGDYLYSISESRVVVSDVRNPENMKVTAVVEFDRETYPQELFLSGETLVVMSSRYSIMEAEDGAGMDSFMPYSGITVVSLYDVTAPGTPELVREFGNEGSFNSARLAGSTLYYVSNVFPDYWVLEEQPDTELRPRLFDSQSDEKLMPMPYEDLTILPGTMEGSYSVITAISLDEPETNEVSTKGFLGGSESMYMNEEHLYLTASVYQAAENGFEDSIMWVPQQADTEIFKFDLDGISVDFLASARVPGALLNQFSMDEYEGYFRLATTEGVMWAPTSVPKNHLYVLDGNLEQVGAVEDLAPSERIYSVRFIGDKAYMVTFRETDPLFVIDVSDPVAPSVLGELKIPGFSNYLHPLGDHHLIGFGYETKTEPVKGGEPRIVTGGMKISLFDVSDLSNPKEADTEIIGGPGTYSALQYDHRALFRYDQQSLFGFPVSVYTGDGTNYIEFQAEGALLYSITTDGIEQVADLTKPAEQPYEDWSTSIQRLAYAKDTLFTIANNEVASYRLSDFEPLGAVRLNK